MLSLMVTVGGSSSLNLIRDVVPTHSSQLTTSLITWESNGMTDDLISRAFGTGHTIVLIQLMRAIVGVAAMTAAVCR
jgi:hypothetical protein